MKTVRVGLVQMCSTADVAENLEAASGYVSAAAKDGAQWVALPENFAYMRREGEPVEVAQTLDGEIAESLRAWARNHQCWILGGTFAECIPDSDKVYNTSLLLNPEGEIAGHYRKIHLFDVELGASGGGSYQESSRYRAGRNSGGGHDTFRPGGDVRLLRPAVSRTLPKLRGPERPLSLRPQCLRTGNRQGPLGGPPARKSH